MESSLTVEGEPGTKPALIERLSLELYQLPDVSGRCRSTLRSDLHENWLLRFASGSIGSTRRPSELHLSFPPPCQDLSMSGTYHCGWRSSSSIDPRPVGQHTIVAPPVQIRGVRVLPHPTFGPRASLAARAMLEYDRFGARFLELSVSSR